MPLANATQSMTGWDRSGRAVARGPGQLQVRHLHAGRHPGARGAARRRRPFRRGSRDAAGGGRRRGDGRRDTGARRARSGGDDARPLFGRQHLAGENGGGGMRHSIMDMLYVEAKDVSYLRHFD